MRLLAKAPKDAPPLLSGSRPPSQVDGTLPGGTDPLVVTDPSCPPLPTPPPAPGELAGFELRQVKALPNADRWGVLKYSVWIMFRDWQNMPARTL